MNDLEDQRDLLANKLAEASGAYACGPTDFNQVNVVLNGTALVQEETSQSLTVDSSGSPVVLRWTNSNSARRRSTRVLRAASSTRSTRRSRITSPRSTTSRRRCATRSTSCTASISGSIAVGAQNQLAAGNLQFDVGLDGGAFSTVTVAGADWSGAGGAAALQAAMQAGVNAAIGAGNATVTVSGGNGNPLSVSVVPTGVHQLQVRATGANAGFATLLGTTPVGTDGVGGRAFFTGTDAQSLAALERRGQQPERGRGRNGRRRAARLERRARVGEPLAIDDRRRHGVPPD